MVISRTSDDVRDFTNVRKIPRRSRIFGSFPDIIGSFPNIIGSFPNIIGSFPDNNKITDFLSLMVTTCEIVKEQFEKNVL